jgi:hypothetical protein
LRIDRDTPLLAWSRTFGSPCKYCNLETLAWPRISGQWPGLAADFQASSQGWVELYETTPSKLKVFAF